MNTINALSIVRGEVVQKINGYIGELANLDYVVHTTPRRGRAEEALKVLQEIKRTIEELM